MPNTAHFLDSFVLLDIPGSLGSKEHPRVYELGYPRCVPHIREDMLFFIICTDHLYNFLSHIYNCLLPSDYLLYVDSDVYNV